MYIPVSFAFFTNQKQITCYVCRFYLVSAQTKYLDATLDNKPNPEPKNFLVNALTLQTIAQVQFPIETITLRSVILVNLREKKYPKIYRGGSKWLTARVGLDNCC